MGRGPKKHLKRLNAPRSWLLSKLGGTWAPRPSPGPHRLREAMPLTIVIRNRLKYALTRREVIMIVMRRAVEVDGKVRTDINYPLGFMDVVRIAKTEEQFRVLYDVKGRFVLHRIPQAEAGYKLCRVVKVAKANKASIGHNPFLPGQRGAIPFLVTHDGRTIRYPNPKIRVSETIKLNLKTTKIVGHVKFETGAMAMITKGANMGRIGVIESKERHPGSFDIVHLRDTKGNAFATRLSNVFLIGAAGKPEISLPKGNGVKLSILEERDARLKRETRSKKSD